MVWSTRRDVLLDDRALVEVGRDEVRGRADQLDPAGVRLAVRVGALEAGQERVVDVDRLAGQRLAQLGGEDLHVAGQHHQLDVVLRDHVEDVLLHRRPWSRREVIGCVLERHPVETGQVTEVGVVGDDQRQRDRQVARPLAEQQVVDAVPGLAGEDEGAAAASDVVKVPLGAQALGDRREGPLEVRPVEAGLHLHPHEEAARLGGGELLELGDVAPGLDDRAGDLVHDAGTVGAGQGQQPVGGVDHG